MSRRDINRLVAKKVRKEFNNNIEVSTDSDLLRHLIQQDNRISRLERLIKKTKKGARNVSP